MSKCKICCTEETRFETEAELDEHLKTVHPSPPPPVCPPGMEEISEFMIDSMVPDWGKNPVTESQKKTVARGKTEAILREWDAAIVNNLLTKLLERGYVIQRGPGSYRSADGRWWDMLVDQIDGKETFWEADDDDSMQFRGYRREEVEEYHGALTELWPK